MLYLYFVTQNAKNAAAQRGAGMAEYALLLALVAIALIAGFGGLATAIDGALTTVGNSL